MFVVHENEGVELGTVVGRGRTAEVYGLTESRVVKLFREGWPRDRVDYERWVTDTVHRTGMPVPGAYDVVEREGRTGIIFQRVEGPSLIHRFLSKPWTVFALVTAFTELHIRMHATPAGELPSLQNELRKLIAGSPAVPDEIKARAVAALEVLPDGDRLVHGDYHPDNVVMTSDGPVIIDWLTATRGDPAADAANTSLLLRLGALPPMGTSRFVIEAARGMFHDRYLRSYKRQSEITLPHMTVLWSAWSLFPVIQSRTAFRHETPAGSAVSRPFLCMRVLPQGSWTVV